MKDNDDYNDYLTEAFCTEAKKENDKISIAALIAGAAVWGLSGNAIAGCALGGAILLYGDKSIRNSNRALEIMHQSHLAAPFLSGDRFQEFRRQFGDEFTLAQLKEAQEYGIAMAPKAEDYLLEQTRLAESEATETATASTATTGDRQPLSNFYPQFRFRPTLIWGGQGSGKTTLAKAIAQDKRANGQQVVVVNPHGSPAAWDGLQVVGSGRDFAAINTFLQHYIDQITARYQQYKDMGVTEDEYLQHIIDHGSAATIICEEMSDWIDYLDPKLLNRFAKTALTESRKVGLPPMFITHDPSLDFLGLKRGAKLRDEGMAIVALEPGLPDAQGKLKGTGKGTLQLPQQKPIPFQFEPSPKPQPVPPAKNEAFEQLVKESEQEDERAKLERLYQANEPRQVPELPTELHKKLAQYLQEKREYPVRKIAQNWGHDKGINSDQVRELLLVVCQGINEGS